MSSDVKPHSCAARSARFRRVYSDPTIALIEEPVPCTAERKLP